MGLRGAPLAAVGVGVVMIVVTSSHPQSSLASSSRRSSQSRAVVMRRGCPRHVRLEVNATSSTSLVRSRVRSSSALTTRVQTPFPLLPMIDSFGYYHAYVQGDIAS